MDFRFLIISFFPFSAKFDNCYKTFQPWINVFRFTISLSPDEGREEI